MHNLKRHLLLLTLVFALYWHAAAQSLPDSVIRQYESAKTQKEKIYRLSNYLHRLRSDTLFFSKVTTLIGFLQSVKDTRSQDFVQLNINDELSRKGEYINALASTLEITNRFEQGKDKNDILYVYDLLSAIYFYSGEKEKSIIYGKKALLIAKEFNDTVALANITNNISTSYSQNNIPDSALLYARQSLIYTRKSGGAFSVAVPLGSLAEAFIAGEQYDSALIYARQSLAAAFPGEALIRVWTMNDLSKVFLETNQYDSARYYANNAMEISMTFEFKDQLQRAYEYLARSFDKTNKPDSAYKYLQLAVMVKDSLYSSDKTRQVQGVIAREQSRLQEMENEKLDFQNKIKVYGLITGLAILGIVAFLLYRNNRQKQKANSNLQLQKEKVENTLQELKLTQQQLIQSEKMASLGELTAGIAHEIQNPLNFVNNFSDVNKELLIEMNDEIDKGNLTEVRSIAKNLIDNEDKINHHGKRADAIVKGMLQHSRSNSGVKEPTDINALADEYLRLAYHGLRAKDKSFNADIKTDFDESIGEVKIIPQEIGRVVLNLINNAFYAVDEKKKRNPNFQPIVTVSTKTVKPPLGGLGAKVEISVKDNGNGIPQKVLDKIFQPFFTTKPTGQGTGLGLSLSYDIVKAHGGELKVNTREGEGSEFIIGLLIL